MSIKELLAEAVKRLNRTKIKFPHLEAEILLSHVLEKDRAYLFSHSADRLSKKQVSDFRFLISQRAKWVPVAYLMGEKEFYGLKFFVDKNVLIPRPETEMMVDAALAEIKNDTDVTIIDVGTGSGCIIISIAKAVISNFKFQISNKFPNSKKIKFFATDISAKVLAVAKKNAKLNCVEKNIKFINGDLIAPLIPKIATASAGSRLGGKNLKLKIVCANLPYLTPAQIIKSPSIKFEPRLALAAGADGLKYYRRLFLKIGRAGLKKVVLLCEIDPSQKVSIKRLARMILPLSLIEIKKDLRGHSRLAIIRIA